MSAELLTGKAKHYLKRFCKVIPNRRVGSQGNQAAVNFFRETITFFGFNTETTSFDCIDWESKGASLKVKGKKFNVCPSPYSLGCQVSAPMVVLSSMEDLESVQSGQGIFLLVGDLTRQQLMPKNFPFYNPDHHKRVIRLLEEKNPPAIITATSRDLEMVGSIYPFPLIEDGDFDIPSVHMTDVDGEKLARHAGEEVTLLSHASRIPSTGSNIIAHKGGSDAKRLVLVAHIDSKLGTPGASDNASGVVVLLLLAEMLEDYSGDLCIEIVAMNGEDYFSNPGEQQYIAQYKSTFNQIILVINVDDVGYREGLTAYSMYGVPEALVGVIDKVFSKRHELVPGEPWYAGDHGIFILNQVPALALTSDKMHELMETYTHTPDDTPDILDNGKLVEIAYALLDLVTELDKEFKT